MSRHAFAQYPASIPAPNEYSPSAFSTEVLALKAVSIRNDELKRERQGNRSAQRNREIDGQPELLMKVGLEVFGGGGIEMKLDADIAFQADAAILQAVLDVRERN